MQVQEVAAVIKRKTADGSAGAQAAGRGFALRYEVIRMPELFQVIGGAKPRQAAAQNKGFYVHISPLLNAAATG